MKYYIVEKVIENLAVFKPTIKTKLVLLYVIDAYIKPSTL